MLAGIHIICFAASYAVAWGLEATRPLFRSGVRGAVMIGFGAAGLLAHSLFLYQRAVGDRITPLSSAFDWYLVAAWVLAAAYLYLTLYHPKASIGLFLLPLVLCLIGVATLWADQNPMPQSEATQTWGRLHGLFLMLGTVAVTIGFSAGLMYLLQASRLKHKRPGRAVALPSLEWLERTNSRAVFYSGLLVALGVLSGIVLNLVQHLYDDRSVPWSDPVVLTGLLALAWMLVASAFNLAYKPARQGRKVAYLTVASFLFLAVLLGVSLFAPSQHRSSLESTDREAVPRRARSRASTSGAREVAHDFVAGSVQPGGRAP